MYNYVRILCLDGLKLNVLAKLLMGGIFNAFMMFKRDIYIRKLLYISYEKGRMKKMHVAASFRFFGYFTILPSSFLKITSCQGVSVKSEDSRRICNFQEMIRAFRDWAGSRLSPAADEPTVAMGLRRRIQ